MIVRGTEPETGRIPLTIFEHAPKNDEGRRSLVGAAALGVALCGGVS
jgi:hypothetical protein